MKKVKAWIRDTRPRSPSNSTSDQTGSVLPTQPHATNAVQTSSLSPPASIDPSNCSTRRSNITVFQQAISSPPTATATAIAPTTTSRSASPPPVPISTGPNTRPSLPTTNATATGSGSWTAETLWEKACRKLREKEPELTRSFEQVLGASLASRGQVEAVTKKRLDTRNEKQWIINLANKSIKVRECGERVLRFVLWSKDLVADALASQPHMALAWSGITMLLPLVLSPSEESDALIRGLDRIADLLRLYQIRVELCISTARDEYWAAIIDLYVAILRYQARSACHLSDNAVVRGIHSISRAGQWEESLKEIDDAELYCQKHAELVDKEMEQKLLEIQNKQMERSIEIQDQILEVLSDIKAAAEMTVEEGRQKEVLQCLAADYVGQKNFNRKRVPNTCRWFLDDPRFQNWRDSATSCILWLSTGPGCGKSVLSRALIDEGLLAPRLMTSTVCYFFFKDGIERRQRGEDALCGLLHQLYTQDLTSSLIRHAYQPMKSNGPSLKTMFHPLWDLFMTTAKDDSAGEIVCLLDALDECQAEAREQLMDQLGGFYNDTRLHDRGKTCVKFLITSRPNFDIDTKFRILDPAVNFIQFSGDDRSDLISQEINLVIDKSVAEVVPTMGKSSQSIIAEHLKSMENRTYLWLHLVLEEIKRQFPSHATLKKIESLVKQLPLSVNKAYEAILNRSTDADIARIILKLILAAKHPFTVDEMAVAVALIRTTNPRSYGDLDLEAKAIRESLLRNICGFFVSFQDSKIFLIHQTAREFLLRDESAGAMEMPVSTWYHSLTMMDAEQTIFQACIALLHFDLFIDYVQEHDIRMTVPERHSNYVPNVASEYPLLEYAAIRWAEHYQTIQYHERGENIQRVLSICDPKHGNFKMWWKFYASEFYMEDRRHNETTLDMVCGLGLVCAVEELLESNYGLDGTLDGGQERSHTRTRAIPWSALHHAVDHDHLDVLKVLIRRGVDVNAPNESGQSCLVSASLRGQEDIVRALLDHGAHLKGREGGCGSLLFAALRLNNWRVVKILLDAGAAFGFVAGQKPWMTAPSGSQHSPEQDSSSASDYARYVTFCIAGIMCSLDCEEDLAKHSLERASKMFGQLCSEQSPWTLIAVVMTLDFLKNYVYRASPKDIIPMSLAVAWRVLGSQSHICTVLKWLTGSEGTVGSSHLRQAWLHFHQTLGEEHPHTLVAACCLCHQLTRENDNGSILFFHCRPSIYYLLCRMVLGEYDDPTTDHVEEATHQEPFPKISGVPWRREEELNLLEITLHVKDVLCDRDSLDAAEVLARKGSIFGHLAGRVPGDAEDERRREAGLDIWWYVSVASDCPSDMCLNKLPWCQDDTLYTDSDVDDSDPEYIDL